MNILINNSSSSDEFELKPINNPNHPCFFQEKMVLKFKPHRYSEKYENLIPIINNDKKPYTPAFFFKMDPKKKLKFEKIYKELYEKKKQEQRKKIKELKEPKPRKDNNICGLCNRNFLDLDYNDHINSEEHKKCFEESKANKRILETMKNYNYNNTPPLKNIFLKKSPSLDTKFIKNDNNYLETKKCQNNVKGNSSKIKPKTTQMINNENNKITSTQNKKKKKSDGKIDIKKNINFDKLNSTSKTISEINLDNIKEGSIIKSKLYEKPQLNNLNQYDLYKSNRKIFIPNLSRKQKIIDLSGYDTNKNIISQIKSIMIGMISSIKTKITSPLLSVYELIKYKKYK